MERTESSAAQSRRDWANRERLAVDEAPARPPPDPGFDQALDRLREAGDNMTAASTESPVTARLRDEYDALGMLSYTGGQADLTMGDVKQFRSLLLAAGSEIEATRERLREAQQALIVQERQWLAAVGVGKEAS